MERNNFSSEETYRKELAEKIISEPDLESRQKVLARAQESREYWKARLYQISKRRRGRGLGTEGAISVFEMLKAYEQKERTKGKKIEFIHDTGKDVYNPTQPVEIKGTRYIAGRMEDRDDYANSQIGFFVEDGERWRLDENTPTLELEDPFFSFIHGEIVLGGVRAWRDESGELSWETVFFRGTDLSDLREFTTSPVGMKDVRLVELENGKIGIFTRPQGSVAKKGKIGYTEIDDLDELSPATMINAEMIPGIFLPEEKGGVNQVITLKNGQLGVIGHIYGKDEHGNKHYCAMSFVFDPTNSSVSPMQIIATREDFSGGAIKVPNPDNPDELADVLFPGGITRNEDGTATLYCGLSDTEAGEITILDPFQE
ncbi:MAG: DUF1861 family protein [bacterium]